MRRNSNPPCLIGRVSKAQASGGRESRSSRRISVAVRSTSWSKFTQARDVSRGGRVRQEKLNFGKAQTGSRTRGKEAVGRETEGRGRRGVGGKRRAGERQAGRGGGGGGEGERQKKRNWEKAKEGRRRGAAGGERGGCEGEEPTSELQPKS